MAARNISRLCSDASSWWGPSRAATMDVHRTLPFDEGLAFLVTQLCSVVTREE